MRTAARAAVALAVAGTGVLVPGAAALAEEPTRTGWWNRLSAGGTALPAPTTTEGDLRISQAPDGPAAYAAVLYPPTGAPGAMLTLRLRPDRTVGTPDVVACVTTDDAWEEGGNQPYDAAPEYDCDAGSALGGIGPDGSSLVFLLDSATQDAAGGWSLALVPTPGSAPFTVDVAAPEAADFVAEAPSTDEEPFSPAPPPSDSTGDDTGAGDSGAPFLTGDFVAPPPFDTGTAEVPPLVAGGDDAPLPEPVAPEPAVAGAAPANPPVLLARPAGVAEDLGTGRRLLALLVLAGGSAAVGYAAGQQRPGPRLIGGRARVVGTAPVAAAAAVPAREERPRGIGRFARERDRAPRRLR